MDKEFMKRALDLAVNGIGKTNPNPLVGAVIVKDDRIIGQGWHERYGEAHAEVNAVKNALESIESSTVYVNLEPCCHFGKTLLARNYSLKKRSSELLSEQWTLIFLWQEKEWKD